MKTRINQNTRGNPGAGKNRSRPVIKESPEDQSDKYSGSMLDQKTYEDYNKERPEPEGQKPVDKKGRVTESSSISTTKNKVKSGTKTYTCSMHPAVTADKPGKCPTCGMKLMLRPA